MHSCNSLCLHMDKNFGAVNFMLEKISTGIIISKCTQLTSMIELFRSYFGMYYILVQTERTCRQEDLQFLVYQLDQKGLEFNCFVLVTYFLKDDTRIDTILYT